MRLAKPALLALSATSFLCSPAAAQDTGWVQFTPWDAPGTLAGHQTGTSVELGDHWAFLVSTGSRRIQVYRRVGGIWSFYETVPAPESGFTLFGLETDFDGGELYVGAEQSSVSGESTGAVHRYAFDGETWGLVESIVPPGAEEGDRFGKALDVNGDWMAISAPDAGADGRVYVYKRSGDDWDWRATVSTNQANSLGDDVAIAGTTVDNANLFASDLSANSAKGEVFSFRIHLVGWMKGPSVTPHFQGTGFTWGNDIEFDGEHLVVAAERGASQGPETGEVSIYDVDPVPFPVTIDYADTLYPEWTQSDSRFGYEIDLDGNRLAVGAPQFSNSDDDVPGAVYVYRPDVFFHGWSLEALMVNSTSANDSQHGRAVALRGDGVLVGAPYASDKQGEGSLFSLTSKDMPGGPAPADVLAIVQEYGIGKPGSLGVPVLSCSKAPVPGETSLIGVSNAIAGSAPLVVWGLSPLVLPFDGGALLVDPLGLITMPTIGQFGQVGWAFDCPGNPQLVGATIFTQAFFADPGADGLFSLAHSKGLALTVGY